MSTLSLKDLVGSVSKRGSRLGFCFFIKFVSSSLNKYTLFDGLAYKKNTSNEQNVRSYYMLNHRIRGFAIGFYFFRKSIQKHPDSVCENDANNEQNLCAYYMPNH